MPAAVPFLKIKLQLYCGDEIAMGPGKADLLEAIEREGSISGAGRALGMSYRRAWLLVDTMNRCWSEPLVETAPGGAARGGARVTPFGGEVLRSFRALQQQAADIREGPEWATLQAALREVPKEHQKS
ncbi:MAG: LysR family transcriptional regulator [Novosphingobium sp.]|nr:LysR family transcriptional regulator [Novosphingobium sp.]